MLAIYSRAMGKAWVVRILGLPLGLREECARKHTSCVYLHVPFV